MEEKCPKCESINWEINNEHNTCYCKQCHGFFGQDRVIEHWNQGGIQLSKYEAYAEIGGYYKKPAVIKETGQFPYRCPICRTKSINRSDAQNCVNECWNKVKEIRKKSKKSK